MPRYLTCSIVALAAVVASGSVASESCALGLASEQSATIALAELSRSLAAIEKFTGRSAPTVIT